ncbi:MAG: histidyl-tRNA synthetase [Candidatus Dependentiae bacterium]|nr:histidyl-tRNA synthetase [Candidatus Dependentiae bacterium]
MIKKVKGTQDLLDMRSYDALYKGAYQHFSTAHFTHIQTPILEHEGLFKRSVGEETDIVGKEMYTFSTNDREVFCLRPEATASTMRAYLEAAITTKPWQVFSEGPMFRHERPQKGRWRQFSQFNVEAINISSVAQDVRFISLLDDLFTRKLRLHDYVLSINYLGTKEDRAAHRLALKSFLDAHMAEICSTCQTRATANMLRIFDCKNEGCQALYTKAPYLTDHLSPTSQTAWQELQDLLGILSISWIHNPLLVRGLDYYNNIVFEFSSPLLGAQSTFCSGGRYDLAPAFDQKEAIPSIGAAIGMERLVLLLEAAGNPHTIPTKTPVFGILPFDESLNPLALLAHQTLHRAGLSTDIIIGGVKKGMKKANNDGIRWLILIGEQEKNEGVVRLKDMESGSEISVSQEDLTSYAQSLIS